MIEFLEDKGVYRVTVEKEVAGKKVKRTKQLYKGATLEQAKNHEEAMTNGAKTLPEKLALLADRRDCAPGSVYVAKNEFLPGLVKIGMTRSSVSRRLTNLSCSMPKDFELVREIFVKHPEAVEETLHLHFSKFRVAENREFFKIDEEVVVKAMNLAFSIDGVDTAAMLAKAFGG